MIFHNILNCIRNRFLFRIVSSEWTSPMVCQVITSQRVQINDAFGCCVNSGINNITCNTWFSLYSHNLRSILSNFKGQLLGERVISVANCNFSSFQRLTSCLGPFFHSNLCQFSLKNDLQSQYFRVRLHIVLF